MMEVTDVHILRWNKSKSLTIDLRHVLSTVNMDDPAELTNFVINNLGVTTQQTTYVITKFVESFGYLLAVNYGDINTFFKDTHSANNARVAEKRIFIRNNITQVLKSFFFR